MIYSFPPRCVNALCGGGLLSTCGRLVWNGEALDLAAEGEISCPMEAHTNPAGLDNVRARATMAKMILYEASR